LRSDKNGNARRDAGRAKENPMKALLGVALYLIFAVATGVANAQSPKAGEFEYTVGAAYSFSDSYQASGGSSLYLSSRTGLRFGVEYFTSSKLSVGFDVTWVKPSYNAELVPDDGSPSEFVSYRSTIFSGHFTGTYFFREGPVTPFVEAGLGWTFFDSNVSDGAPIVGCWWDPFWGYICSDFYSTYNATNFSYGAGVGMRWNFARDRAVNVGYRWLEIEADGLGEKPTLESAVVEFIFRF
jgi:opacity protein-like surface antigen